MPSFDIVSEVDWQEVRNAVDQTNREVRARFDFKGSDARVEASDPLLTVHADDDYKIGQVVDILQLRLAKRSVEVACLDKGEIKKAASSKAVQEIKVRQGIDAELAKRIVKLLKGEKIKVQAAIQQEQVRVSGKKRDDLQQAIAFIREQKLGLPMQYVNFRD
ncbi:MAG: YajQ family cyclic di-GMP-binding protein [bacterium]